MAVPMMAQRFSGLIDQPQVVLRAPPSNIVFFDVDRTLLMESSIAIGLRHLSRQRRFGAEELLSLLLATGLFSLLLHRMPLSLRLRQFSRWRPNLMSMQSICLGWFWDCLIESISPKAV